MYCKSFQILSFQMRFCRVDKEMLGSGWTLYEEVPT